MIIFTQDISVDKLLHAYNNNVIRFRSNNVGVSPITAVISLGSQTITIYPLPSGDFYFNFLEYITALIGIDKFVDDLQTNIDASDINSFTYAGNGYLNFNVNILINFTNLTTDSITRNLRFTASVEQLENYKKNVAQTNANIVQLPLYPSTNNSYYAKYFEGYPFDISFCQSTPINIKIENTTNLLDATFQQKGNVTRLFFSDGRVDESITDYLPIALGLNILKWDFKNLFIHIDKVDVSCGVYMKWFNNYNGYSYWLFPNYAKRDLNRSNIGTLNTDFSNIEDTYAPTTQLGVVAGERLVVNSDKLKDEEFNLLRTILTSPKVYFFTGQPFAQSGVMDWLEVEVTTTSTTTRNSKGQQNEVTLQFNLPELYTQKL